jgi:hypothetical protein
MELPKVEVRFQHLFVNADVYFGARALPTLFNFARNVFEVYHTHTHPPKILAISKHFFLEMLKKNWIFFPKKFP